MVLELLVSGIINLVSNLFANFSDEEVFNAKVELSKAFSVTDEEVATYRKVNDQRLAEKYKGEA